jgi:hypothetical protein
MKDSGKLLGGVLLGAGAMYVLDPDRGARRRALIRDQGIRASRKLGEGVGAAARDVRNRSTGAAAELSSRLKRDQAGDEIVQERVRSALGRVASHPGAVDVAVYSRRVILSGAVPATELDSILRAIRRVRGVREVENQLEVYEGTEGVPSLQGSGRLPRGGIQMSPAGRLLLALVGSAVAAAGLRNRGGVGTALTMLGLAGVCQAVLNLSLERTQRAEDRDAVGRGEPEIRETEESGRVRGSAEPSSSVRE